MLQANVTFSESALRALVNNPTASPGIARVYRAGLNRLPGRLEFLVHCLGGGEPQPCRDDPCVVVLTEREQELLGRRLEDASSLAPPGVTAAVIALGVGPAAGRLAGVYRAGGALRPVDRYWVAGAGLPGVGVMGSDATRPEDPAATSASVLCWPEEEVLSRTIGALGEAAWRRLRELRVTLVGCGRNGSLLAMGLGRLGVRRLTLLDPDRIEPHNLGEMDAVTAADVGRPKAEVLAEALVDPYRAMRTTVGQGRSAGVSAPAGPTAVTASVLSLAGLVALKPADVVICCVDNPAARLATGALAALYLKPLLDLGTGVLHGAEAEGPRMGADVRLVLPGRCLRCLGGVAGLDDAGRELLTGRRMEAVPRHWRRERAGSLRSLNGVAVHLGLRLLEDLAAGRRAGNTWLHLEFDATGIPRLEHREPAPVALCPLCALTGTGDGGVGQLPRVLGQV